MPYLISYTYCQKYFSLLHFQCFHCSSVLNMSVSVLAILYVCRWTVTFYTLLWGFKHQLSTNESAVRSLQELKVGRVNHLVDPKACYFLPDCCYSLEDHSESSLPCKRQILCLVRNVAPYYINQNESLILQIILHSSVIPGCEHVSNFSVTCYTCVKYCTSMNFL